MIYVELENGLDEVEALIYDIIGDQHKEPEPDPADYIV